MEAVFDDEWCASGRPRPRLRVLEVRSRADDKGEPVAWLLVERIERKDFYEGQVWKASLTLAYRLFAVCDGWQVDSRTHTFAASYSALHDIVNLTSSHVESEGAIFLDPLQIRGHRIGTYLLDQLVAWAKEQSEAARVAQFRLPVDTDDESQARRKRFYARFNIHFDDTDPGTSRPMRVGALQNASYWQENITELSLLEYLEATRRTSFENHRALIETRRAAREVGAELRSIYQRPVRWVASLLVRRYGAHLLGATLVALVLLAGWLRE